MRSAHRAASSYQPDHHPTPTGHEHCRDGCDYDQALVECAAGQTAGIADLYASEYKTLKNLAFRIVRDRADDVVHDAFVQILRDSKGFDPARGSARAWIYTIVRNTALKKLRADAHEIAVDDEELLSLYDRKLSREQPDRTPDYDGLKQSLQELEPIRRASLILAIVDGRTHAEIAALLQVPVGTIKSWIRRELIALRQRLEGLPTRRSQVEKFFKKNRSDCIQTGSLRTSEKDGGSAPKHMCPRPSEQNANERILS